MTSASEPEPIDTIPIKDRMKKMLLIVGIVFGCIFLFKAFMSFMIKRAMKNQSQVVTVSAMTVGTADWQPKQVASGSLRAIRGVNITTELAGMVENIYFVPGSSVKAGTVLVQLKANSEIAALHSLEAKATLAQVTYNRDKAQLAARAVSQQTVDNDLANLKSLQAQVIEQMAIIEKKTIRAPFDGRLGINNINPGQYVSPGDAIVTLQTLDPIYVDFYVPQQLLADIKIGMVTRVFSTSFPHKIFMGKITTINPLIDSSTRNVIVEATLANPNNEITPGMFVTVEVMTGSPHRFITVPHSAVTFNPYGDIVYVIRKTGKDENNQPILTATQAFVITGETRGDQVTILKGIKVGDTIVTSGQLKLKNGTPVDINNAVQPLNNPAPILNNDH